MVTLNPYILVLLISLATALGIYDKVREPIVKAAQKVEEVAVKVEHGAEKVARIAGKVITFGQLGKGEVVDPTK
jgi:hypothetical protein